VTSSLQLHCDSCCNQKDLQNSEEDLDLIERCSEEASNLSLVRLICIINYISGYEAKKEDMQCSDDTHTNFTESEFTTLLSRGKLLFPQAD